MTKLHQTHYSVSYKDLNIPFSVHADVIGLQESHVLPQWLPTAPVMWNHQLSTQKEKIKVCPAHSLVPITSCSTSSAALSTLMLPNEAVHNLPCCCSALPECKDAAYNKNLNLMSWPLHRFQFLSSVQHQHKLSNQWFQQVRQVTWLHFSELLSVFILSLWCTLSPLLIQLFNFQCEHLTCDRTFCTLSLDLQFLFKILQYFYDKGENNWLYVLNGNTAM